MTETHPPRHTAFITGATGVVGQAIVKRLTAMGWQVTALHRPTSNTRALQDLGVNLLVGDVVDAESFATKVPKDCDVFFHVAADLSLWSRHNDRQAKINVGGTKNAVDAALYARAKRFIHTSTISAYGRHNGPIHENTLSLAETSFVSYERTKRLAELEVLKGVEHGLNAVIINPAAIMGPGFREGWAFIFQQIQAGQMNMQPPGTIVINHLNDVVDAHIAAIDKGRSGENYILNGDHLTCATLVLKAGEIMGMPIKEKVVSPGLFMVMAKVANLISKVTGNEPPLTPEMVALLSQNMVIQSNKAEVELGYRITPWEICLTDMYNWLKAEGRL